MVRFWIGCFLSSFSLVPSAFAGIPPGYPPPLNVGLTEPVGPSVEVEALAGPKTEPVDAARYSDIFYVSSSEGSDATGTGSNSSPYGSIQYAISQVPPVPAIDLYALFVSSGFYPTTAPINVPERVHVFGGFDATTWERDIEQHQTILDGGKTVLSIIIADDETLFDGLTFQNGGLPSPQNGQVGGGIHVIQDASVTITNNVFRNDSAKSGGGVYNGTDSQVRIKNNLFYGNSGSLGSAIGTGYPASCLILNNVVRNSVSGPAIRIELSFSPIISQNLVKSNSGTGIDAYCIGGVITENIIIDNESYGIDLGSSKTTTVSHNKCSRNGDAGILADHSSTSVISHNITVDNGWSGIQATSNAESEIFNNVLTGNGGGGVIGWAGTVRNNVAVGNTTMVEAGGIRWNDGIIERNVIVSNDTPRDGGGIYAENNFEVTIMNNLIALNRAARDGGGVFCNGSTSINNIVFLNESSRGGGVFTFDSDSIDFVNNTILRNLATDQGGGFYVGGRGSASFFNNIIFGNQVRGVLGQISQEGAIPSFQNNLVQGGYPGENIINADPNLIGPLLSGTIASATYDPERAISTLTVSEPSLIPDSLARRFIQIGNGGSAVVGNTTDEIEVWGNFSEGPAANPGTQWSIPDFHLREDSPCIGAGLGPDALSDVPLEDIDGDVRSGTVSDIGADGFNGAFAFPTPTPTETDLSLYDLYPIGGDHFIDARDLLEFIATHAESPGSILEYTEIWMSTE